MRKAWAELAYRGQPSYTNSMLLADFEDALGNVAKANELRDKGLPKATNAELRDVAEEARRYVRKYFSGIGHCVAYLRR